MGEQNSDERDHGYNSSCCWAYRGDAQGLQKHLTLLGNAVDC